MLTIWGAKRRFCDGISRRDFLRAMTGAGTATLLAILADRAMAEPPPETKRIRIPQTPSICTAPQYIVTELLKAEGFTEVRFVKMEIANVSPSLASGTVDFSLHFAAPE